MLAGFFFAPLKKEERRAGAGEREGTGRTWKRDRAAWNEKFEIGGILEVTCDRCGSPVLPMNLWDEFNVVVKLAEEPDSMNEQEEDPDVYYISRGDSHLHIADWIFEFVNLSIPMQRMCSEEKIGSQFCDNDVLDMLRKGEDQPSGNENPIWKGLEKLKKNLDN